MSTAHGETAAYLIFGAGAFALAATSALDAHIIWARSAAVGYAVAAYIMLCPLPPGRFALRRFGPAAPAGLPTALGWFSTGLCAHRRTLAARLAALTGAVVIPFFDLLTDGSQLQNEINVVADSGRQLLTTGVPYRPGATDINDIDPYLPLMSVFGFPRAILERIGLDSSTFWHVVGDPRIWCALAAVVAVVISLRVLGAHTSRAQGIVLLLIASPTVALELCASGVDLPFAGFLLLTLVCVSVRRIATGAVFLAAAFAIKWISLLVLPVVLAYLIAVYGLRSITRFLIAFTVAAAVFTLPAMLALSDAISQVFLFPTGNGDVPTPARSPMPGVLLVESGRAGTLVAYGLLALCALVIAALLVRRPPRTFSALACYTGGGLTVFFLLAPVGRFGYLLIPILLFGFAYIAARAVPAAQPIRSSAESDAASRTVSRPSAETSRVPVHTSWAGTESAPARLRAAIGTLRSASPVPPLVRDTSSP